MIFKKKSEPSLKIIFIIVIIVLFLLPSSFLFNFLRKIERDYNDITAATTYKNYVEDICNVVNTHMEFINNSVTMLEDSKTIREYLRKLYLSPDFIPSDSVSIADIIETPITYRDMLYSNHTINAITIFYNDSMPFYAIPLRGLEHSIQRCKYVYNRNKNLQSSDGIFVLSGDDSAYAYWIQDYKNIYDGRYYGKIVIEIAPIPSNVVYIGNGYLPSSRLSIDLQSHPETAYYLYDNSGLILFSSDVEFIGSFISSLSYYAKSPVKNDEFFYGEKYIIYNSNILSNGIHAFVSLKKADFPTPFDFLSNSVFFILIFILYLFIVFIILRSFYTPIARMYEYSVSIKKYNQIQLPIFNPVYKEIVAIIDILKDYMDTITFLKEKCNSYESEKRENQIRSLQSQINPHFLFNMLDVIGWKASQSGSNAISSMILHLSEILRYDIKSDQAKIPLRKELNYIHEYFELQRLSNIHEFTYCINVDDELLDIYCVPKLILQPIVENSIIHGISKVQRRGEIQIDIWEDLGGIICRVKDNGIGFDSTQFFFDEKEQFYNNFSSHNHIALRNIQKRLKILYGEPYGIKINSTPGKGTIISVYIPFDRVDSI